MQLLFSALLLLTTPAMAAVFTPHITAYFSPEDHLKKQLITLIDQEKKSVLICSYTITHRGVITALIEAKKRGVEVEVVVDRAAVKASSPIFRLAEAAIPVDVWDPKLLKRDPSHRPLMHNKFCVFGSQKVWTGSFDFTYEADRLHQDNALVIDDSAIANSYKNQFFTIKHRSCVSLASYLAANPKKRPKK